MRARRVRAISACILVLTTIFSVQSTKHTALASGYAQYYNSGTFNWSKNNEYAKFWQCDETDEGDYCSDWYYSNIVVNFQIPWQEDIYYSCSGCQGREYLAWDYSDQFIKIPNGRGGGDCGCAGFSVDAGILAGYYEWQYQRTHKTRFDGYFSPDNAWQGPQPCCWGDYDSVRWGANDSNVAYWDGLVIGSMGAKADDPNVVGGRLADYGVMQGNYGN
jgi:hypothetical protein